MTNILRGVASIGSVHPPEHKIRVEARPNITARDAISSDFDRIGNDFRVALKSVKVISNGKK